MQRKLLSVCAVLVCAAPALAAGSENQFRDLRGTVSSLSNTSIAVTRGDRTLTCAIGDLSPSVGQIGVGDRVMVRCRRIRKNFVLRRLNALDPPDRVKLVASALAGDVTALGDDTITVGNDKASRVLKCSVPARFGKLATSLEVGKRVAMRCRGAKGTIPQLAQITVLPQPAAGDDEPALEEIRGLLSEPDNGKVAATNGDGPRTLSCRVPAALAATVATLTIGDPVLMVCRGGELVSVQKIDAATPPPSPAPHNRHQHQSPRQHQPRPPHHNRTVTTPHRHQHRHRHQHQHRSTRPRTTPAPAHVAAPARQRRSQSAARLRGRVWVCRLRRGRISGR